MLISLVASVISQSTADRAPPAVVPPAPPAAAESTVPRQTAGSISDADYPAAAIRAGEQGTTAFTIVVGPDGKPSECRVTGSSGSEVLDSATCTLVTQRFRYEPARDASGKAVTAEVTRRVTWRFPEDSGMQMADLVPRLTFAPGELHVTFGGAAEERPRCAANAVGAAFQARLPVECFGYQRAAAAELTDEPYRVIIVQRLHPEKTAAIRSAGVAGATLVGSMSAIVEANGQGHVTQCTPVDTSLPLPPSAVQQRHICDGFFYGFPLFLPIKGAAPHRAAFHIDMYTVEKAQQPAT